MNKPKFAAIVFSFLLCFLAGDARAQSGQLSSDSPCALAVGGNACTVNVTWQKSGAPLVCLWLSTGGLFACGSSDNETHAWPWANAAPDTFILKAHQSWSTLSFTDPELSRVVVQGIPPSGSLSSNSPCQIAAGSSTCKVGITWQKTGAPIVCLWLSGGGTFACGGENSATQYWTWANPIPDLFILRGHQSWASISSSDPELTRITVYGVSPPPPVPTCGVAASATTLLVGQSATIVATCSGTPNSYNWTVSPGAPGIAGVGGSLDRKSVV